MQEKKNFTDVLVLFGIRHNLGLFPILVFFFSFLASMNVDRQDRYIILAVVHNR
jgi:hypothetical protein